MCPADQAPRSVALRSPGGLGLYGAVLLPGAAALPRAAGLPQPGAGAHAAARALARLRPGKQRPSTALTLCL